MGGLLNDEELSSRAIVAEMARTIHRLERRLSSFERSFQLASLDTQELTIIDAAGVPIGSITDGGDGNPVVKSHNPQKPPVPSTPAVTAEGGGVKTVWDGTFVNEQPAPGDFSCVEIYKSATAGFLAGPATLVDSIHNPAGASRLIAATPDALVYVKLRTLTTNGMYSDASGEVPVTAASFITSDVITEIQGSVQAAADAAAHAHDVGAQALDEAEHITETHITDGAITTPKIAAGSITGALIQGNQIIGAMIQAETIQAGNIQVGTITGDRIAFNTIQGVLIQAGTIQGDRIQAGTVTGDRIQANTIQGALLQGDAIDGMTITGATVIGGTVETAAGLTVGGLTAGVRIDSADQDRILFFTGNPFETVPGALVTGYGHSGVEPFAELTVVSPELASTGQSSVTISSPGASSTFPGSVLLSPMAVTGIRGFVLVDGNLHVVDAITTGDQVIDKATNPYPRVAPAAGRLGTGGQFLLDGAVESWTTSGSAANQTRTVTHALGATPNVVTATPRGQQLKYVTVDNADATSFRLNVRNADGTSIGSGVDLDVYWFAVG